MTSGRHVLAAHHAAPTHNRASAPEVAEAGLEVQSGRKAAAALTDARRLGGLP